MTNDEKQEVENNTKKVVQLVNKDMTNLRDHIDEKFKTQEQFMSFKIEQLRSDTYKVVFWSSLVQILTIIGGIIALYKIFKP